MRPYYALYDRWGLTTLSTGQPFFVDTETLDITAWILLGGIWEVFVDDVLCAMVRPGDCFLDVGANMGYYTVKIGGQVGPEGRIFAFEPNPRMFKFLKENVDINALRGQAQIFNIGAGAGDGELSFAVVPSHPGGGNFLLPGDAVPSDQDVFMARVAAIDDMLPVDCVADLIKIDVEGFEPAAFEGMQRLLARSPDAVIVSEVSGLHWRRFGDPAELLTKIADGRRILRIFTDGSLEEMSGEALNAFDRDSTSYVLLLPRSAERTAKFDRFVNRFQDNLPDSAPVAEDPDPVPAPAPVAEPRRSLLRRAVERLARAL
jgi:FkbM family methyltransferase